MATSPSTTNVRAPTVRPLAWIVVALIAWLFVPAAAHASGDGGCSASWKLRHRELTGCASLVMLSPGNDTRVNLVLLLAHGAPRPVAARPGTPRPQPLFDWTTFKEWSFATPVPVGDETHAAGEGSRCLSDAMGTAAFVTAVAAARQLTTSEKASLIAARRSLRPTCADAGGGAALPSGRSPTARAFATYLGGARAFYAGDFAAASARFGALVASDQPWLRETARYMLGRVEVNRAQVGAFDEWGYRDDKHPVDATTIGAAEARLRDYLRLYPSGSYAGSARGLLRRVYWLGGNTAKLAATYAALFAQAPADRGLDDAALAEEIDTKLLPRLTPADTTDPTLLATLDLQAMRGNEREGVVQPVITRAALEAQRPRFARVPALFDQLLATHAFYVAKQPREVLRLISDAARRPSFDPLQLSRQMLRGMALDAVGDGNARGFWLDMLPGTAASFQRTTIELALALHDERTEGLPRVFALGSPIHDATIRDILLTNVAGAALLRRQATDGSNGNHERAVALFVLLYKELTRGAFRDFVADLARVPANAFANTPGAYDFDGTADPSSGMFVQGPTNEGYLCPALRDTARRLAGSPRDATAQLCLAEFVRLNDLDGYFLDIQSPADELGGTLSQFGGPRFSRLETYKALIAAGGTSPADRAYALFRAVNCYAPSQMNQCGGTDVAPAVRRGWFQQLHTDFPTSRWARELRYHW